MAGPCVAQRGGYDPPAHSCRSHVHNHTYLSKPGQLRWGRPSGTRTRCRWRRQPRASAAQTTCAYSPCTHAKFCTSELQCTCAAASARGRVLLRHEAGTQGTHRCPQPADNHRTRCGFMHHDRDGCAQAQRAVGFPVAAGTTQAKAAGSCMQQQLRLALQMGQAVMGPPPPLAAAPSTGAHQHASPPLRTIYSPVVLKYRRTGPRRR
jgi:hypothetical protein